MQSEALMVDDVSGDRIALEARFQDAEIVNQARDGHVAELRQNDANLTRDVEGLRELWAVQLAEAQDHKTRNGLQAEIDGLRREVQSDAVTRNELQTHPSGRNVPAESRHASEGGPSVRLSYQSE